MNLTTKQKEKKNQKKNKSKQKSLEVEPEFKKKIFISFWNLGGRK